MGVVFVFVVMVLSGVIFLVCTVRACAYAYAYMCARVLVCSCVCVCVCVRVRVSLSCMSGIQALNLAADVHPTPAQINACEAKAKTAFGEAGGDVDSFEREKQEGAATAVGDTMKACVKTALESKTSPTREDYDTAHRAAMRRP